MKGRRRIGEEEREKAEIGEKGEGRESQKVVAPSTDNKKL